ncbi:MAG: VOC family protein, partial [Acidobacteria bacterium]|nr:VOC family protein [Acidobacteriota bacterium]
MTTRPNIECERLHAGLVVPDIQAAVDFYTQKLGFWLAFTWGGPPPTFAGINIGDVQIFLEKGEPRPADGCSAYFLVGDADELYAFHQASGVTIAEPIGDREYHIRDYVVR